MTRGALIAYKVQHGLTLYAFNSRRKISEHRFVVNAHLDWGIKAGLCFHVVGAGKTQCAHS